MKKYLCIHGHFYQPPREDPWLDLILPEGSAAPAMNWNERILNESYAPIASARRLGPGGIVDIVNCYEWMSFNAGPTLLHWMEQFAPTTYHSMLDADAKSLSRLGHGNALAQIYHHVIMPLASELDKELEVAWAVEDFQARFGRAPEGMWLSETAVDTATLEVLADYGITFTILAPGQAAAVTKLGSGDWRDVSHGGLDIRLPYAVSLPSGRQIAVFFYDGPISQAVAFERLLEDGEKFWRRLADASSPGLLSLATDGETYGHHFKFGEMGLAYILDQARQQREDIHLTNYATFLEAHPPTMQVRLHEPSAWSCAHGVERWRSDCGCTTGGHPGWKQTWRKPLRDALNAFKTKVDEHFFDAGQQLFKHPRQALVEAGKLLSGRVTPQDFADMWLSGGLSPADRTKAFKLIAMQKWALAAFASCAWFFDEISRIEPVNGLTFALRAMELAEKTQGPDFEPEFSDILEQAPSNIPEMHNGNHIWQTQVVPRRETTRTLVTQALLHLWAQRRLPGVNSETTSAETVQWPGVSVTIEPTSDEIPSFVAAKATLAWTQEPHPEDVEIAYTSPPGHDPYAMRIQITKVGEPFEAHVCARGDELAWNKRQAIADTWIQTASNTLFQDMVRHAQDGIHLITNRQEAQSTLTFAPLWNHLAPGLAYAWLTGESVASSAEELMLQFLRDKASSPVTDDLLRRIASTANEFFHANKLDQLETLLTRCHQINLNPNFLELQNSLFPYDPKTKQLRRICQLVGMAS
ncbi:DUF3536 domain-containing protein [Desulfovibrio inopinatus]|uniref:DUF3536 domain-containing protein n=1 Tax=Desulfovibrio inopinatus TaxID=102109 RepID=UPI00040688D6|nr:DUF3536 domain-containing protein [Desulfovibrio inopinatus]